MQESSKYSREQVAQLLLELETGEMNEREWLARHGITADELARWRKEYDIGKALSAHKQPKAGHLIDFALGVAVLCGLGIYGLHHYAGQATKDRAGPPLLLMLCMAVLALIYHDASRGVVRAGRWRTIRRGERPFAFWVIIGLETLLVLGFGVVVWLAD